MRGRGPLAALSASPTMVGAITTLIAVVAVFLAYNANNGLPFVSVYRVSVDVPNSARLVRNNEVRIGGHRVGVVEAIEAVKPNGSGEGASPSEGGEGGEAPGNLPSSERVVARLNLKLDKAAEPLPQNSIFRIRYRSTFGLKYLDITRGDGEDAPEGFTFDGTDDGDLLSVDEAEKVDTRGNGVFIDQTEFDDLANTFDRDTRDNARENLTGFGNAFTGRGLALNETFAALGPLFRNLEPVATVLAEPATRLERLFPELADAARIVAPIAVEQASLFSNIATTFAAITRDVGAYQEAISEGVATLDAGIRTLPAQRAFLADFADLSHRLRPGISELPATLPTLNRAIRVGTPVLLENIPVSRDLKVALTELERLVDQEETLVTIERLGELFDEAKTLAKEVVPAQTVCNYWNYWFTFLPEHLTERDQVGFNQRIALLLPPLGTVSVNLGGLDVNISDTQIGGVANYSGVQSDAKAGPLVDVKAPVDLPPVGEPGTSNVFKPRELAILHGPPYAAHGEKGTADCLGGQTGYLLGDIPVKGQPKNVPAVVAGDYPGSVGPTTLYYNQDSSRELRDTRVKSRQP